MVRRNAPAANAGCGASKLSAAAALVACLMLQGLVARRVGVAAQVCGTTQTCGKCDAGYYLPVVSGNLCCQCPAGQYQPNCGYPTSCTACSTGTYNPSIGSTSSAACLDHSARTIHRPEVCHAFPAHSGRTIQRPAAHLQRHVFYACPGRTIQRLGVHPAFLAGAAHTCRDTVPQDVLLVKKDRTALPLAQSTV